MSSLDCGSWISTVGRIHRRALVGGFALLALLAPRLAAADSSTAEPEWEARIYGFAWLPALYSHLSIGPFTTNINVTADGWRALSTLISPESPDDNRRFRLDLLVGPRLWYFRNKLSITIPPARVTVGGVMVPVTCVMLPREVTLGRTTLPGILARDGLNTVIEETTSWVDAVIGFRASVSM